MRKTTLLAVLLCVAFNIPSFAKNGLAIGFIDVSALTDRLQQLGVSDHSGALKCEASAIEVDESRVHKPTLRLLIEAKNDAKFNDDFVYQGNNSYFPSLLLELIKKSQDKEYAKRIASKLLCEKIELTARTLDAKPSSGTGSMILGGLDLLLSERISNTVPANTDDCYFSSFFYPDNDVGLVCDKYFVETPNNLKNILSKDLKISSEHAGDLYGKIDKFISLMDDEIISIEPFRGSCTSCLARSHLGEVEFFIYQAVTRFRTGKSLFCKRVKDGDNRCSVSDYEAGILGPEEAQTYELVDSALNRQWGLLKKQAATNEHWQVLLDTQRAFVAMKLAMVKIGKNSTRENSDKIAIFLSEYRSGRINYLREILGRN